MLDYLLNRFYTSLSLLIKPIMIKEIIMVNNFFKIAIVIVCFSTKPLFAQSLNYGYLKLTKDVNSVEFKRG